MEIQVTHWQEVGKLEEEVRNGNTKIIAQFLEFLIKNKVSLRSQLLTDICESAIEPGCVGHYFPIQKEAAWGLLHNFAHDYYRSKTNGEKL